MEAETHENDKPRRIQGNKAAPHLDVQHGVPYGVPGPPFVRVSEDTDRRVERGEVGVSLVVVGLAPVQEVLARFRDEDLHLRATVSIIQDAF